MVVGIHEQGKQAGDSRQVTPAELNYARQIGVDLSTLDDPEALKRLRQVLLKDNVGNLGVNAATLNWLLVNEPVDKGGLDFRN